MAMRERMLRVLGGRVRARSSRRSLLGWGLLVAGILAVARLEGVTTGLNLEHASHLRTTILAYGWMAPVMFIALYVGGGLAFVPGFVLTLLSGLIFGPWAGLIYASIGSTICACVAFIIARYALRGIVESWIAGSRTLRRIDAAVTQHGFRVVMLTRLVPMLPFGVLNYVYGATGIGFVTYAITSWVCMLPATAALTSTADAVMAGRENPQRLLVALAVSGAIFGGLPIVVPRLARWSASLAD